MKTIISFALGSGLCLGIYFDANQIYDIRVFTYIIYWYLWIIVVLSVFMVFYVDKQSDYKPLSIINIYTVAIQTIVAMNIPMESKYILPLSLILIADYITMLGTLRKTKKDGE